MSTPGIPVIKRFRHLPDEFEAALYRQHDVLPFKGEAEYMTKIDDRGRPVISVRTLSGWAQVNEGYEKSNRTLKNKYTDIY